MKYASCSTKNEQLLLEQCGHTDGAAADYNAFF